MKHQIKRYRPLYFSLLATLAASTIIGSGFAIWQFTPGSYNNEIVEDVSATVLPVLPYGQIESLNSNEISYPKIATDIVISEGYDPKYSGSEIRSFGWIMFAYIMHSADYRDIKNNGSELIFDIDIDIPTALKGYIEKDTTQNFEIVESDLDIFNSANNKYTLAYISLCDSEISYEGRTGLTINAAEKRTLVENQIVYDGIYANTMGTSSKIIPLGGLMKFKEGMKPDTDEEWQQFEQLVNDNADKFNYNVEVGFRKQQ